MSGLSKLLLVFSAVLVSAAIYIVILNRQTIFFAVFHRPFSLEPAPSGSYQSISSPKFTLSNKIPESPMRGHILPIQITATANQNAVGYLEVWITSPNHKQIYQSPLSTPDHFSLKVPETFNYSYYLPSTLAPGTYTISELITSFSKRTDYYVNENFDEFTLQ